MSQDRRAFAPAAGLERRRGVWMGEERKRGKLEVQRASARRRCIGIQRYGGEPRGLALRCVITLDSDAVAPESAWKCGHDGSSAQPRGESTDTGCVIRGLWRAPAAAGGQPAVGARRRLPRVCGRRRARSYTREVSTSTTTCLERARWQGIYEALFGGCRAFYEPDSEPRPGRGLPCTLRFRRRRGTD